MESELRELLERKAEEMNRPRDLSDQSIRKIQSRRAALMAAGTVLVVMLVIIVWRGAPHWAAAGSVRPANNGQVNTSRVVTNDDHATVVQGVIRDTGKLDKAGWYVIPTLKPKIGFRIDSPGWRVNLNEPEGYFNISYDAAPRARGNVLSIVNYTQAFDPSKSLAKASARVQPPDDVVSYLRANPHLRVGHVHDRTIGGVPAIQLQVTGLSEQRGIRQLPNKLEGPCGGPICGAALVYNSFFSPVTPEGITERLIFFDVGGHHFVIENLSTSPSPMIRALIRSIRFPNL
jgi:hypothetical protein